MNYSFSTSYDKEKGYLKGNDNQRVMLNLTTSAKLTKNLTFDVSLNTVFTKKENVFVQEELDQIVNMGQKKTLRDIQVEQ